MRKPSNKWLNSLINQVTNNGMNMAKFGEGYKIRRSVLIMTEDQWSSFNELSDGDDSIFTTPKEFLAYVGMVGSLTKKLNDDEREFFRFLLDGGEGVQESSSGRLEAECIRLYKVCDDISTYGDQYKPEISGYFDAVDKKASEGLNDGILYSDGYSIMFKEMV